MGEYVQFKNFEKKQKSPFMIYADFENILVPQDNGKQNLNDCYTNKYQKHVACNYGYKLVCVDDKFMKPFKWSLDKDAIYNCISSIIEESKYCGDVINLNKEQHFNKELLISKEKIMKILRTQPNVGSVIMIILVMMLK